SDNDIRIMKMHPDGNAWLGTSRGFLNRFNPYDKTFRHYFIFDRDSLRGVPVVSIAFQDKIIWAGAIENGGITKLDQETNNIQRFFSGKGKNQLPSNEIFSLFVDSQDELWIGTDVGLVKYNKKNEEFILISGQKRVPSESILNINEDREGNLWLSTPGSLIKYHPSDTTLVIYDETDGIYTSSTTSLLTKEGKLLFGGINGLNFFDPSGIFSNKKEPEIVFTDLQIKNQSVDINPDKSPLDKHINYTSEITLNWDQSFFSIYFAAMNFSHPEKNQYACKLEGFEDDWNYIGTRRYASYTNVPPGYYVFRVIASNNDGIWNETGRQLKINIKPPWWKTSGAYIAYIAIILISIYLITRIALMREQMKSELRLQQVEFEKKQALLEKEHEVDQMKIQFLTNIAHEFRTPLTLVISPVNDILSSMKISPEATGHLELVKKNAHRLLRLINQILDFSKVEAGFMKLEVAYGNFSKAIEYINQSFELRAKRRNINYICEISHKNAFGYFDLDKIEKILYNIISNSFKFTGDNDTIKIEVNYKISDGKIINSDDKIECEEALISVSDTGIGIPKEKLNMVFNRFFQAHSKETGTGIGLSLAKSLTRIHKGNIKVFSDEKQGTLFQIRIPLNKQIFPEDSIRDGQNEKDFYPSFFLQTEENNFPVNELNIALINQLPSMLIVEDEKDMQEYIKFIFKKDFTIYTANNGLEGLNKAKELIPDIVISDIMMPEMDGIELTKKLKSAKETSHVLVILLTAKITKDDKITGFETGADDYILKPFESDELRLKVNNIVETRKKFQKQFSNHPLKNLNKMVFNSTDKKIMEKLFELINENIENPNLDHKFLCENLGISRAQLYRKIKALTNQTAHDFIRNIRLNKAVELMLDRGLSVSEVMYKVGFQNHSYFSKCFKKKFGKPPSGYVKNNSDN
ncbi:MAG: response regulator, partial [bacterium]